MESRVGLPLLVIALCLTFQGCGGKPQNEAPPAKTPDAAGTAQTMAPAGAAQQPGGAGEAAGGRAISSGSPLLAALPPGPVQGTLETGRPYAVGASGRNSNVQLTVTDLQLLNDAGGTAPPAGEQFVVLNTVWKNLVPAKQVQRPKGGGRTGMMGGGGETETVTVETPYLVQTLPDNLYLLVDGRYVAEVSAATDSLPEPLAVSGLTIQHYNEQVRGTVAFAIPAGGAQSLALQFFDFNQGHITLPLYGKGSSAAERPLVGPQRNQLFEVTLYGTQFVKRLGDAEAPTGKQYVVVECAGSSTATGAVTQIDLNQYAFLIQDGVYQSPPLAELPGLRYALRGLVRFIPGFPRRGVIAFLVPDQAGRLELLLAASQMDPLRFVLTPDRQAAPQPSPRARIQDGDTVEVLVNSWAWRDRIGDAAPAAGSRFLVLDVTMANKETHSGLTIQSAQFSVLAGQTTIEASSSTEQLPHPLVGERTVSAGTRARFEVAFEVPAGLQGLRLRYQGFTKIDELPIR